PATVPVRMTWDGRRIGKDLHQVEGLPLPGLWVSRAPQHRRGLRASRGGGARTARTAAGRPRASAFGRYVNLSPDCRSYRLNSLSVRLELHGTVIPGQTSPSATSVYVER